jgi:hypothetical protein
VPHVVGSGRIVSAREQCAGAVHPPRQGEHDERHGQDDDAGDQGERGERRNVCCEPRTPGDVFMASQHPAMPSNIGGMARVHHAFAPFIGGSIGGEGG